MAPHDTNTPREARRHRVPLIGMAVLLAIVLVGFFWWIGRETEGGGDPVPGTAEIEDVQPAQPAPAN
jgi:hypothetical protein